PPKAGLWNPFIWLGLGRGIAGSVGAAGIVPAIAGVIPAAPTDPAMPLPNPNQRAGSKGSPLAGVQRAAPSGGVQGQRPWPSFLRPIAMRMRLALWGSRVAAWG